MEYASIVRKVAAMVKAPCVDLWTDMRAESPSQDAARPAVNSAKLCIMSFWNWPRPVSAMENG